MQNLMNVHTGSVDTRENWEAENDNVQELIDKGDLVEVKEEDGTWVEA